MLSSIIGRNKNRIPAEVVSSIINGTQEIIDELGSLDIKIYNTGGETADVGDLVQTVIIDGEIVMDKGVIPNVDLLKIAEEAQIAGEQVWNTHEDWDPLERTHVEACPWCYSMDDL